MTRFHEPDYQLVWPRALFVAEAARLLNYRHLDNWNDRCVVLLEDAFVRGEGGGPLADFGELPNDGGFAVRHNKNSSSEWSVRHRFLKNLMENARELREDPPPRRPYWRQRRSGTGAGADAAGISVEVLVRNFIELVRELNFSGYLDKRFGTDCVDEGRGSGVGDRMQHELGVSDLWPLDFAKLAADVDLFLDVVEFLHDVCARPVVPAFFHDYNECGWHFQEFDIESGRAIYRWRVNKLLSRWDRGLRLAEDGEDVGRLVTVTDEARTDLVQSAVARGGNEADQVRHALALFRKRGADAHAKRSAVATLALVLEERRYDVLQEAMANTDRGALFQIANGFHIRHQRADQKRDYDDFFLDWIFWVYLASIELTDRVRDEHARLGGGSNTG